MKLSIEEIKKKTMELLKIDNITDVDYITQEKIDSYNEFENVSDEYLILDKDENNDYYYYFFAHGLYSGMRDYEDVLYFVFGDNTPNLDNACGHTRRYVRVHRIERIDYTERWCLNDNGDLNHRKIYKITLSQLRDI